MTDANNFTNRHTNIWIMSLSNVVLEICIHNNIYILAIIVSIPLKKKKRNFPCSYQNPKARQEGTPRAEDWGLTHDITACCRRCLQWHCADHGTGGRSRMCNFSKWLRWCYLLGNHTLKGTGVLGLPPWRPLPVLGPLPAYQKGKPFLTCLLCPNLSELQQWAGWLYQSPQFAYCLGSIENNGGILILGLKTCMKESKRMAVPSLFSTF
jgi:hypothetical protein